MSNRNPEPGILLLEAIRGKKHWFLTSEEVRASWRLIDPVQACLSTLSTPIAFYEASSSGPAEADAWMEKEGMRWFS